MNSAPSSDKTLFEIFKDIALKYPDRIALDFMGSGMTYKKILHKIVRTATAFHSYGIREGDCVAICAPNCPQAIVSIYALSSIGACAVMTNPLSPPNQLVAQLRETGCKAVVILDLILPKIRKYFIKKRKDGSANVFLDNLKTVLHFNLTEEMPLLKSAAFTCAAFFRIMPAALTIFFHRSFFNAKIASFKAFVRSGGKNPFVTCTSDGRHEAPAVVFFSGGTSGNPKAVVHSSESIDLSAVQCLSTEPPIENGMSMLAVLPVFHIFGFIVSMHLAFIAGGKCILIPRFSAENLAKDIISHKPTYMAGVPTLFEALLSSRRLKRAEKSGKLDFSGFRVGFCGGDKIAPAVLKGFNDMISRCGGTGKVVDGYGLTECCPVTVMLRDGTGPSGSVGKALPGIRLCVVRPGSGEVLPNGTEGEICINAHSIMSGYFHDPLETTFSLVKHDDGKMWLHTGDVGIIDDQGFLFLNYRLRQIIKVSGYTIFPIQVENVLLSHPDILRACVVAVSDSYSLQKVKAHLVLKPAYYGWVRKKFPGGKFLKLRSENKARQEISDFCSSHLSPWAIPSVFEFHDSLPENMLGKTSYGQLEDLTQ